MKKLVAICLLLVGCTQAEEKMSEELQAKVLELHDVLMPQTEQIISLKSKLDSLSTGSDSTHVRKLISSLDKADKSMMDWMHQFSIDSLEKMDVSTKVIYLKNQYTQLTDLQKLTDSTLNAAQKYRP
jgi:type IV pilus biogenesis protein CpaD/CtpE